AKLGGESLAQSHLAWQTLADRNDTTVAAKLDDIATDVEVPIPRRVQALWAYRELKNFAVAIVDPLLGDDDRNIRREGLRAAPITPETFRHRSRGGRLGGQTLVGRGGMVFHDGRS